MHTAQPRQKSTKYSSFLCKDLTNFNQIRQFFSSCFRSTIQIYQRRLTGDTLTGDDTQCESSHFLIVIIEFYKNILAIR